MNFIRYSVVMLLVFLYSAQGFSQETYVKGIVFEDTNKNKIFEAGEPLLEDIPVSSMSEIVFTNKDGLFELPVEERDVIFIIKPSNYHFHLRSNYVPDFFHLIYPEGSPDFLDFPGVESASIPDTLYFPLLPSESDDNILVNMTADPQMPREREVWFFRESIIPAMAAAPADFTIFLGDIADNNLGIYPQFMASLKALNSPVYGVFGNHDVNYRSPGNDFKAETFRSHFGPDYYSFNYGQTHFIVLNSVNYSGWNNSENKPGSYFGGIDDVQFQWLKKDLELTGDDMQIVLLSHIPIHPSYFDEDSMKKLFSLLKNKPKLTAVSGHLHRNKSWKYTPELFWDGEADFRALVAGSASGSWWSGPHAEDSIPAATCVDGSPQGFFQYQFRSDYYNYSFVPAKQPRDFQLRINLPHREISKSEDDWQNVSVNVFAGDERCRVRFSLENGEFLDMKQYTGIDPFLERTHYRRINGDGWTPSMAETEHLWMGKLPAGLSAGTYSLKAEAEFPDGQRYSTVAVFELVD